ncbi:membrane integrity-associated transporter subunit PqiC [Pandoraea sp. NPDC087047]|uniref:PqiC family protein n=1 Tax=Pandoraea sp. NPDC087047 TaxID=3364390 RepID=UPI00382A69D3
MTRSSLPRATPEAGATATKTDTTAERATSTASGMAALAATAALALTLAGCASPQPNFYTLMDASGAAGNTGGSGTTDANATTGVNAPATPYAVEVAPVAVPDQVDRPQIVVTRGGARVDILEASRWAAPLKTELTSTISRDLTQRLGAMDVYGLPRADGLSVYRVSTSVQRFESVPGEQAALTAVWSVRKVPGDRVLTCRFAGTEAASGGIAEVVAAQRKLVDRLADGIGNAIATSAQGATPRCQN